MTQCGSAARHHCSEAAQGPWSCPQTAGPRTGRVGRQQQASWRSPLHAKVALSNQGCVSAETGGARQQQAPGKAKHAAYRRRLYRRHPSHMKGLFVRRRRVVSLTLHSLAWLEHLERTPAAMQGRAGRGPQTGGAQQVGSLQGCPFWAGCRLGTEALAGTSRLGACPPSNSTPAFVFLSAGRGPTQLEDCPPSPRRCNIQAGSCSGGALVAAGSRRPRAAGSCPRQPLLLPFITEAGPCACSLPHGVSAVGAAHTAHHCQLPMQVMHVALDLRPLSVEAVVDAAGDLCSAWDAAAALPQRVRRPLLM